MARQQQPTRDVHQKRKKTTIASEQVFEFVFWALMQLCQGTLGIANLKNGG